MSGANPEGLDLLRKPFPNSAISKLPKPTKKQSEEVKNDFKKGFRCGECGGWHHRDVVHLDYVGHAALTDRLLDCDPHWNWEPVAFSQDGSPAVDQNGGMWIRLTVCGVTRLGYGDADGKSGGNAVKERIGDALRNAAMRFGAALDLWHKGDLHCDDGGEPDKTPPQEPAKITADQYQQIKVLAEKANVAPEKIAAAYGVAELHELTADAFSSAVNRLNKTIDENAVKEIEDQAQRPDVDDEIPYEGAA